MKDIVFGFTFNKWTRLSVSTSTMDTIFSEAAARNCPLLGWKRTCVLAPCAWKIQRLQNRVQFGEKPYKSSGACLCSTNTIRSVDVPEANIIVSITRTENLCFLRVKIKGHYRCSMTRNCSEVVTRLHKIGNLLVSHNRTQKNGCK